MFGQVICRKSVVVELMHWHHLICMDTESSRVTPAARVASGRQAGK